MKKMTLMLALLFPAMAMAAPRYEIGKGFSVGIDTSFDLEGVGARDLHNGQWLSGLSKEMFPVFKGERKVAYIAGENLFIIDDAEKGFPGLAIGIPTGPATEIIQSWAQKLVPSAKLPAWAKSLSNWTSFEIGAGYRFFVAPDGISPWAYTVGGRVRIPLDKLWPKKA